MPDQRQIFAGAVTAAPDDYTINADVELTLIAVNANFTDNGAAVDWLPAVVLISDSGHVIARALDQGVTVTAGDNAEVSWFPGVKHAGGGTPNAISQSSSLYQSRSTNQAIPSGVLTPITFETFTSTPGYTPGLFGNPLTVQNPITFGNFGPALMTLIVNWPAAAFDRYIEMTIANPDIPQAGLSPRYRSQISPDGDRMVLAAGIEGGSGAPATTVTANVFQASGVNQNITATWICNGFIHKIFFI